ncbi:ATP-binding protein [Mucilaginibacter aquatilis]|uniref:Anti-sigma regulatory factor n=1 Tax=Mucilaginibacter aquatilis TaxID=1517760 RepID=A0A6I4IQJ4_9SPHI|nr:ATP-binding protein [Mucilaginibacter aquatilis]MVN91234.1 anti-sigma regulatory factor [Mucilaginibacter aquatilis]
MDKMVKTFAATLDSLEPIRNFIAEHCVEVNLNKKQTYGLCLAVDEIATNIINYGYPATGASNGQIEVHVQTNFSDQLKVTLIDTATPFNPLQHLTPEEADLNIPLEERPIGGLGIVLARQSVDDFNYEYKDGSNYNIFVINAQA